MSFPSRLRFITTASIAFSLAALLCTAMSQAQQDDQLAGKWKMHSTTPDGNDVYWTLSITYKDGKYSATLASDDGEATAKELKIDGSKIHLRAPYQGHEYDVDLKLVDGKLVGTWSGNGDSGETKGEKATA